MKFHERKGGCASIKSPVRLLIGIILILLSAATLVAAMYRVTPTMFVDFPCFFDHGYDHQLGINEKTRMAYCISIWPLEAISGGGIYADGSTEQDEVTVKDLRFKRADMVLYVNDKPLNSGEVFKTTHWRPSVNPWLIFTTGFSIKNDGLTPSWSTKIGNVLYVSGDVHESWIPNPLGLILLSAGIWLTVRGAPEVRPAAKTKAGEA